MGMIKDLILPGVISIVVYVVGHIITHRINISFDNKREDNRKEEERKNNPSIQAFIMSNIDSLRDVPYKIPCIEQTIQKAENISENDEDEEKREEYDVGVVVYKNVNDISQTDGAFMIIKNTKDISSMVCEIKTDEGVIINSEILIDGRSEVTIFCEKNTNIDSVTVDYGPMKELYKNNGGSFVFIREL